MSVKKPIHIGIIGAGWYGCHLALALTKAGYKVTLFEKNSQIMSDISGFLGIRLHAGPHYPRSEKTRESCHRGFKAFMETYPDLVVPHEYSIYALGKLDADGNPPKVTKDVFEEVCKEFQYHEEIDPNEFGYKNMYSAHNIDEPSIVLGDKLRKTIESYLNEAGIEVVCNYDVLQLEEKNSKVILGDGYSEHQFDKVINATSYQNHLQEDKDFPFEMEAFYQPCLALLYKDKKPGEKPISFIVMDGNFNCLMPYITQEEETAPKSRNYIMTHGKWTLMGAYETPEIAKTILASLEDKLVEQQIKTPAEAEMLRFWPEFADRFEYIGWIGKVLAKLKTRCEFRSAITYEKDNIIHIVPGKVSNIFDVEEEVKKLIERKNLLEKKGYYYVHDGVLDQAEKEIKEKPSLNEANTANIKTYDEIMKLDQSRIFQVAYQHRFFKQPLETHLPSKNSIVQAIRNPTFILKCMGIILASSTLLFIAVLSVPLTGINAGLVFAIGGTLLGSTGIYYLTQKSIFKENQHEHEIQDSPCIPVAA